MAAVDIRVSNYIVLIVDKPNRQSEQTARKLAEYIEKELGKG